MPDPVPLAEQAGLTARPVAAAPGLPPAAEAGSRLAAMRRHLEAARPASGNEALRLLRQAFPDTPLAERVKAADGIDRYRF